MFPYPTEALMYERHKRDLEEAERRRLLKSLAAQKASGKLSFWRIRCWLGRWLTGATPSVAQRLVLCSSELYRVPPCYRILRIQLGTAYITQAGRDRILQAGEVMQLECAVDAALVSVLCGQQVVLELSMPG